MHSRHLFNLGAAFSFNSYAINNAYLLYEHSCHAHKLSAKDVLGFRLELVHLLLEQAGSLRGVVRARKVARDAQSARVCELDRVSNIVDVKRGRCHYCHLKKKKPQHYTYLQCVMYDCAGHPALQNFIFIDILVLNY